MPPSMSNNHLTPPEVAFVQTYREVTQHQLRRINLAMQMGNTTAAAAYTAELCIYFFTLGRTYEQEQRDG